MLEIHPEFSGQKPLLKKLDQELSSDLGQIIEYLGCNGDTMQNIKAYNWMRQALLLSSLQVQEGKHRQEQYIFQEISDCPQLVGRFGAKRSCLAGVKRGEPESDYLSKLSKCSRTYEFGRQ